MQNIHEILKKFGIEVPADSKADFDKEVAANYKTVAEHEKKLGKVEGDRDNYAEQLKTAQETLKGFEGVDLATIQSELATWKSKAENAEKDYAAKLEARDFEDALKAAMDEYKFSSTAAKNAVTEEVRKAGLKLKDGKILGLNDLMETIKTADASAFITEREETRARFTEPKPINTPSGPLTAQDIIKIKNPAERQRLIEANPQLFKKG